MWPKHPVVSMSLTKVRTGRTLLIRKGEKESQRPRATREPWGGISPRHLTKSFRRFSFIREGTGRLNLDAPAVPYKPFRRKVHGS